MEKIVIIKNNALSHAAKTIIKFLEEICVEIEKWLPNSPELNLKENFRLLKLKFIKRETIHNKKLVMVGHFKV